MASLQRTRVKGHSYWRIVESRRINGKPRPVPVAYLGRAEDILAKLQGTGELRVKSLSHGAVGALWAVAKELRVGEIIDRHLAVYGRRTRAPEDEGKHLAPKKRGGLSVGESLTIAAVGRAAHSTSKRGFSGWFETTTLGELAQVQLQRLNSQHFWDQMDQLPVESIEAIEREIVSEVIEKYELPLDTLLYDGTNFFTFIASTNKRASLPLRGHNKQKRDDLRQVSIAMLCTRQYGIPIWHQTYEGNVSDAHSFDAALPSIRQRLLDLKGSLDDLTIVYDKGNVSRANQQHVDQSQFHYVTGLTVASQKELVRVANAKMAPLVLSEEETVPAYRTKRLVWGKERTLVVLVSERLRDGQMRGILQHAASAEKWLSGLADTLRRGKQKRSRGAIERDIQRKLTGRQYLHQVIEWELTGADPLLSLTFRFNTAAFEKLADETLGRVVLATDRHKWSTQEIIRCYRNQATIEALFAHLKDHEHISLRPQFHWTDQKLIVHVFMCELGHILARVLLLKAQRAGASSKTQEHLLDQLAKIRRATVVRLTGLQRKPSVSVQLEDTTPELEALTVPLGIA
jgi:transposase